MTANPFSWRTESEPPIILQTEEAECGLAALAMCAAALGYKTDLLALRRHHEISMKGTTLARLLDIASEMKMQGRAVRVELDELALLKAPCILHWDLNHFVVLVKVDRNGVIVNDPALGRREYSMEETSKRFSGVALELTARAEFVKKEEKTPLVDIGAFFRGQRGLAIAFVQVLLLSFVLETFSILAPLLNQWLIDDVLVTSDTNLLLVLVAAVVLLTVTSTATRLLRSWILLAASISWNLQTSANVFLHMLRLPVAYFEKRQVGDVSSRFHSVEEIQNTISTNFIETILDGLMAIVALIVMFVYSVPLGLLVVVAALLYGAVRALMFSPYRLATEESIVRSASRDSFFYETLRGIAAIKFFSQIGGRVTGWMNAQTEVANATVKAKKLDLVYLSANGLITSLERGLLLYLMAHMILDRQFTIGMMVAFLAFQEQFMNRTMTLVDRLARFRLLRLQGERLADIVLTEPEAYGGQHVRAGPTADESINFEVRNVSFRYAPGEDLVLRDVSFTFNNNDSIAIVGPSGCGKSTLMKIMTGILLPEGGEILVNGIPMSRMGMETYRALMGTMMQEDYLFSGSILDNIAMFDSAANEARVIEAASRACIHDDIIQMPMGYQSLVGGMGSNISGGQKQRLLLARALYKQPRFLFLDEYTSMLDFETEMRVQESLAALPIGRFVITHRRRNLLPGDRVYFVWEHGLVPAEEFEAELKRSGRPNPYRE
ncbi:MAG: peptidase domain-containing ABC transporter [Usitatibacteraceae bacterium]